MSRRARRRAPVVELKRGLVAEPRRDEDDPDLEVDFDDDEDASGWRDWRGDTHDQPAPQ